MRGLLRGRGGTVRHALKRVALAIVRPGPGILKIVHLVRGQVMDVVALGAVPEPRVVHLIGPADKAGAVHVLTQPEIGIVKGQYIKGPGNVEEDHVVLSVDRGGTSQIGGNKGKP